MVNKFHLSALIFYIMLIYSINLNITKALNFVFFKCTGPKCNRGGSWQDSESIGFYCSIYEEHKWCKSSGGFGAGWGSDWGSFAKYSNNGYDATSCVECGCKGRIYNHLPVIIQCFLKSSVIMGENPTIYYLYL